METTKKEIRERFAHEAYPIHVVGRHVEITDAIKSYAVDKMAAKLKHYGARVVEAVITMDIQWIMHSVSFRINVNNIMINVTGKTDNMYSAIDQAIDRLDAKLSRYLRKIHEHRAPALPDLEMNVNVIQRVNPIDELNDMIDEENRRIVEEELKPHEVVSQETCLLKTLTQEEAIMKMELSNAPFMLYKSEEEHSLKVIYRRGDGNYGIIETKM